MNKELNIGDYVRTKNGTIGKIIAIDLAKLKQEKYPNHPSKSYWRDKILISCYRGWRTLQNIGKISPNIIDLLEVGDVIKLKPTKQIQQVLSKNENEISLTDYVFYDLKKSKKELIKQIEWVITREQIEQMEYKVGE